MTALTKLAPQPGLFSQLYNVFVKFMGTPIPIAHFLMTKKSEKFYNLVFEKLKRLGGENWVPEEITSDFEKAVLNSLKNTFPDANLSGCRFNLPRQVTSEFKNTEKRNMNRLVI